MNNQRKRFTKKLIEVLKITNYKFLFSALDRSHVHKALKIHEIQSH